MNTISERPADYTVYKKSAALRISIQKLDKDDNGYPKAGGYFLVFAPAASEGGKKYDWDKRGGAVTIFLGVSEVPAFCRMIGGDTNTKIFHDPDKGSNREGSRAKSLYIGTSEKGVFLNISAGEKKLGVALSQDEIVMITTLMKTSMASCLGW